MPKTEIINGLPVTTYTAEERADGLTKARLVGSIENVRAKQPPFADDAAYVAFVCEKAGLDALPQRAAESYYEQHAGKTVAQLEQELAEAIAAAQDAGVPDLPTPIVDGVPTRVSKRQAKTLMELTPHSTHGNLWNAALAAAGAIADPAARIVTTNYLVESQWYERDRVQAMRSMLGMSAEQADQLLIAAAKL